MPIAKGIKVKIGYSKMRHEDYAVFIVKIYTCLLGNPYFPNPPVALAVVKNLIDDYKAALAASMDGGRNAILRRNSLRQQVDALIVQLAFYVENQSHDDPAIFATSGFEAHPQTHKVPQPLEKPLAPDLKHGSNSGIILVYMPTTNKQVLRIDVRHAEAGSDGLPGTWTENFLMFFQKPYPIRDLKAGALYAFQIRLMGKVGSTDWSDSAMLRCI